MFGKPTADIVIGDWSHGLHVLDPGPRLAFVQMPSVGVDTVDEVTSNYGDDAGTSIWLHWRGGETVVSYGTTSAYGRVQDAPTRRTYVGKTRRLGINYTLKIS